MTTWLNPWTRLCLPEAGPGSLWLQHGALQPQQQPWPGQSTAALHSLQPWHLPTPQGKLLDPAYPPGGSHLAAGDPA